MEILTAGFGFCIGIDRAYREMNKRALNDAPFTVAHQNSKSDFDTLRRIARKEPELLARYPALSNVSVTHDVAAMGKGERLVLGFHGLPNDAKADLAARGVELVDDLMCPFIAKLDRVVERHAAEGFDIAIVGAKGGHHCRTAQQIAEQHGRRCFVIERKEDIDSLPDEEGRPIALVGQVTGNTETFKDVIERVRDSGRPIKVAKTMCSDSHSRQKAVADIAQKADLVILVDDGGDAARSVFEVCSRVNQRVHRIRSKDEIRADWFDGAGTTAIVSGILTPEWSVQEVVRHVQGLCA